MSGLRSGFPLVLALGLPAGAAAHVDVRPGALVSVNVEVEGVAVPLLSATDGSGRFYLEAREGARYALHVANRTSERLGVAMTVDGLNVISGERPPAAHGRRDPGRMYILDPWDSTVIRGWRTSLQEVRRFTFVDERASYATRSGKANSRMGWIEIAVHREQRPWVSPRPAVDGRARREAERGAAEPDAPPATAAPQAESPRAGSAAGPARDSAANAPVEAREAYKGRRDEQPGSHPGTGWGQRSDDPAVVVQFDPQPEPAERVTLRYEYAAALRALGILPRPAWGRDRLRERERGEAGFAQPPAW